MTRYADWYFDFVSPFPYFQLARFDELPDDLVIRPKPVLFAALLGHWGNKGPAEIPAKRLQTNRYCLWLARKLDVPFKTPPGHPFNPLAALRLALVLKSELVGVRAIYDHIWAQGNDGQDIGGLGQLAASFGERNLAESISRPDIKQALRRNTNEAIRRGVFGVPTFVIDDTVFWGSDITDMMLDYLRNPEMFDNGRFGQLKDLPIAAHRADSWL